MTQVPLFLDASVPMYAAGAAHPCKAACVWIMEQVAEGDLAVAIDTEIVQEVLYRYGAIGRPKVGTAMATSLLNLVPGVYPVLVADARAAIGILDKYATQGVMARDALHAAVMQSHGLTHIISADQHFDRIDGITRISVGAVEQVRSDIGRLR